jgi:lysophospholipase L1-like esterase
VWGEGAENVAGWNKQVAVQQKWQQINFAVRGTGFNKPNVTTTSCVGFKNVPSLLHCAQAYKPDIVVISAGINDCDYVSIHPVQTQQSVQTTMWRAKTLFPNAQILATSVVSFTSKPCWNTLNGWIADAAADAGVEYAADASTWVLGQSDMQVDGVHPNDLGHTEIANRFSAWFESLPK